jgi:hypothetical protein
MTNTQKRLTPPEVFAYRKKCVVDVRRGNFAQAWAPSDSISTHDAVPQPRAVSPFVSNR